MDALRHAAECRPSRGSNLISKRKPVAAAKRSRVRMEGRTRPLSRRAITGCVVRILRASSCCVRPARLRASITADAKTNSSSRASYALLYFGSFIHFLCRSAMRAIAIPPSFNRFRAVQRQLDLAPRRFFRLLHEDANDHNATTGSRHIQRPRDSAATLQPHFPDAALEMLHVRLSHTLQTLVLDELRYPSKPRPHVLGQRLDLSVNGSAQGLDRP